MQAKVELLFNIQFENTGKKNTLVRNALMS